MEDKTAYQIVNMLFQYAKQPTVIDVACGINVVEESTTPTPDNSDGRELRQECVCN